MDERKPGVSTHHVLSPFSVKTLNADENQGRCTAQNLNLQQQLIVQLISYAIMANEWKDQVRKNARKKFLF